MKDSKPKNPTNAEHKAAFSRAVEKWQKILGLNHWRFVISKDLSKADMGNVTCHLADRLAIFQFGLDFGTEDITDLAVEDTALHEVLHVLLHDLAALKSRNFLDTLGPQHAIINVLIGLLLPQSISQGSVAPSANPQGRPCVCSAPRI